jgi:hypothetical protein
MALPGKSPLSVPDPRDSLMTGYYQRVTKIIEDDRSPLPGGRRYDGKPRRPWVRHIFFRFIIPLCALAAILYVADSAVFVYRMARGRAVLGVVKVDRFIAIEQKGGKTEFVYGGVETQICAHSVFRQAGNPPCWYARRRTEKQINL